MLRINTPTAATGGHFVQGNPDTGVSPTQLSALWCENVQEEICAVIEGEGITVNGGQTNQLYLAIQALIGSTGLIFPAGATIDYAGASVPSGWLECLGQVQLISACPGLYAAIGNTYNTGAEAAGYFRLPDFQGRVAVGAGAGAELTPRTLAQHGGEETHLLTIAELPSHSHPFDRLAGSNTTNSSSNMDLSNDASSGQLSTAAVGGSQAHNNMPPFLVTHKLIKLGQFDSPE